jgi:hypothetical protein
VFAGVPVLKDRFHLRAGDHAARRQWLTKSTTVKISGAYQPLPAPSRHGETVSFGPSDAHRHGVMVPQEPHIFPH